MRIFGIDESGDFFVTTITEVRYEPSMCRLYFIDYATDEFFVSNIDSALYRIICYELYDKGVFNLEHYGRITWVE